MRGLGNRTRFVGFTVERDPDGPLLKKDQSPPALRTPNGLIWAHEIDEFFYIPRSPQVPNYVTTWSRSMLKTIGEQYDALEQGFWDAPLYPPRVIRPWPVLKLPNDHPAQTDPPIGAIDEGCDHEHWSQMMYRLREDGYVGHFPTLSKNKIPRRCPSDPSEPCISGLRRNDAPGDTAPTLEGLPHDYLWCEHFRAQLEGKSCDDKWDLIEKTVYNMAADNVIADHIGVRFLSQGTTHSSASQPEKHVDQETADLFSTKDLPKLEENIPEAFLPDILLVHDPEQTTRHTSGAPNEPVTYRRVVYRLPQSGGVKPDENEVPQSLTDYTLPTKGSDTEERVAHLHLRKTNQLGTGHHSSVYRAPLTLPPPLSAHSPTGQVTVAAKLAFPHCTAHALLHNEARTYNAFPEHAQLHYCGYNVVPPCHYQVPVGPIVPKFYGFYLPVGEDGKFLDEFALHGKEHKTCNEDQACRVPWISPILLMEECGEPVDPEKFMDDERTECFSLMLRLHALKITQGSFYVRNVLIQPGPLSAPPSQRTLRIPSFRIIDFGRARVLAYLLTAVKETDEEKRKTERARVISDRWAAMQYEEQQAREQFLIEMFDF
ncbi:hypothetical protein C8Q70DRAFT_1135933 [Cubamyces menziesii]|uniref:Protein kinase domain-containing protein n=1 Tax=Trametes cubensis TaxID=1111947 RepID=A0AAD7TXN9_9APHY|nr:hypothetical protein C8Q70DRAFT_1135933 [Cubamyces menziesii]KAJ8488585.1 hypothetical protein ONZ51_g3467 [Trametes cubensis]